MIEGLSPSYFVKKTYCVNGIHYALAMIQEYLCREGFGEDKEGADYRACASFGPLYK